MQNGTQPNAESEIDKLHASLASEAADTAIHSEGNPDLEKVSDSQGSADSGVSVNADFCQEILAVICRRHAEKVRNEFLRDLEPIVPQATAQRIAGRAAMAPEFQAAISQHGSQVLCKYGLAKFVNDEAVLIGAILGYTADLNAARKERDEILKKHSPPNGVQGEPATGAVFGVHETKVGIPQPQPTVNREPVPSIST